MSYFELQYLQFFPKHLFPFFLPLLVYAILVGNVSWRTLNWVAGFACA